MNKKIDSVTNTYIIHLCNLIHNSRYRHEYNQVVIEGKKLVKEIAALIKPLNVLVDEEVDFPAPEAIKISKAVAKKLSDTENSEGVFAEFPLPPPSPLKGVRRLLVLDRVSDPGNMGTLLRTALALGWDSVFFLQGGCDPFNSKVLRASKGALFSLPYQIGTWETLAPLVEREKLSLLAADLQGTAPPSEKMGALALVLGSEAQGLSEETREKCRLITLPIKDSMESLNVAQAGAILMYLLRLS